MTSETHWRPVSVRVPASASNLGAGFDFLGMALNLWLEARVVIGGGAATYAGTLADLNPVEDLLNAILREAGLPDDYHLEVTSQIPLRRGLGASAASTVAGLALTMAARGERIDRDEVFGRAAVREGHPDNAAPAVFGGAVIATVHPESEIGNGDTASRPSAVVVHPQIAVAIVVPDIEIETNLARSLLPREVSWSAAVQQARAAAALVAGLGRADGDLIRLGMQDAIAEPHRKHLIPGYDKAVAAGLDAGAFGVTISGSGSTVIALTQRDRANAVANAMSDALGAHGVSAAPHTPAITRKGLVVAKENDSPRERDAINLNESTEG